MGKHLPASFHNNIFEGVNSTHWEKTTAINYVHKVWTQMQMQLLETGATSKLRRNSTGRSASLEANG